MKLYHAVIATLVASVAGCSDSTPTSTAPSSAPAATANTAGPVLTAMLDTMGGRNNLAAVQTLVMKGGGTRRHFGQIPATGAEDPVGTLSNLVETIDLVNGRAAFDNNVVIGDGFGQHRTEAYTTWQGQRLGWGTTEGRPNHVTSVNGLFSWATHNTPEFLLRRNPVSVALSADSVAPDAMLEACSLDGDEHWCIDTRLGNETLQLFIDKTSNQLKGFSAIDTETMWGDTNATYIYSDWRPVGTLQLPFALEIRKDDGIYADLQYDSITLDDPAALAIFDIPANVTADADQVLTAAGDAWVPLQWVEVAENVTHVVAFSHHSMVVEFPSFVVVVEGPYTEGQSLTLARGIEERWGKPIRYVAPTHPHYDHTGGIRGLVSVGADVLVAAGHEAELRQIVESPHTNPPDALAIARAAGRGTGAVQVFSGMYEIAEGAQSLQLYEVQGIPHVAPKVLAFVPATGVLFQSDLFFGGPSRDAAALYQAINDLGITVEQIVGGHGGVLPYEALADAIASAGQ